MTVISHMFKQLALAAFIMHSAAATPLVIRDDVPDVQQQKDQFTRAHNSIRARFGAAPLGWGDELRGAAHQWATQCTCRHSPSGPFGEIITASSTNIPIETVVEARWANHTGYDPSDPLPSDFTQLVWKSTKQFGCAQVQCPVGMDDFSERCSEQDAYDPDPQSGLKYYYVCMYWPAGDTAGKFSQNVQVTTV